MTHSVTWERIRERISDHGYNEMSNDAIYLEELLKSVEEAEPIEDYPEFWRGPAVLVLHRDEKGTPIHAVWGIPKGQRRPAVLVTAYRPDPARWSEDFRRRSTDEET